MAHFAELDSNNTVLRVLVVSNDDIKDQNGQEQEQLGITFLQGLLGQDTNWIQTSYNNNFRTRYAGIGYSYNETLDAFIAPKPYDSWILNEETADWEAPIPMPTDTPEGSYYSWNEATLSWDLMNNL